MMAARAIVRGGLERVLLSGGAAGISRRRYRSRTLVLAYHNILPDREAAGGEASLHLPRREFAAQLELLVHTHEVVPLASVVQDSMERGDRPRVAITFDDAYRGAVTAGVEELAHRGLPATIFVAPGCLGAESLWWDALVPAEERALPVVLRQRVLHECYGSDAAARRWAAAEKLPLRTALRAGGIATEDELIAAARTPGITLGSHSWSHPNLTRIAPAVLAEELSRPLVWLRERFHNTIPWLAYPYGLANSEVEKAAEAAGYRGALRIEGGWMREAARAPFAIPRLNIAAGLSPRGFALRVSGLLCGR